MQDILTTAFNSVAIAGLLYITAAFAAHARYRFANPIAQEAPIPTAPKPVETASLAPTSISACHGTPAPATTPEDHNVRSFTGSIRTLKALAKTNKLKRYNRLTRADLEQSLTAQLA